MLHRGWGNIVGVSGASCVRIRRTSWIRVDYYLYSTRLFRRPLLRGPQDYCFTAPVAGLPPYIAVNIDRHTLGQEYDYHHHHHHYYYYYYYKITTSLSWQKHFLVEQGSINSFFGLDSPLHDLLMRAFCRYKRRIILTLLSPNPCPIPQPPTLNSNPTTK